MYRFRGARVEAQSLRGPGTSRSRSDSVLGTGAWHCTRNVSLEGQPCYACEPERLPACSSVRTVNPLCVWDVLGAQKTSTRDLPALPPVLLLLCALHIYSIYSCASGAKHFTKQESSGSFRLLTASVGVVMISCTSFGPGTEAVRPVHTRSLRVRQFHDACQAECHHS